VMPSKKSRALEQVRETHEKKGILFLPIGKKLKQTEKAFPILGGGGVRKGGVDVGERLGYPRKGGRVRAALGYRLKGKVSIYAARNGEIRK